MEWISIEDAVPERAQSVIVYIPNESNKSIRIQLFKWIKSDREMVSHWMPIPEPPK